MFLVTAGAVVVLAWSWQRTMTAFPDGFDAVEVAPKSHKVLFENAYVRVLEVDLKPGETVPWHHHRWPSLMVAFDQGGPHGHFRYHAANGKVMDIPAHDAPTRDGKWEFGWMGAEPMHSVENLDTAERAAKYPSNVCGNFRIEIKPTP